jgi:hypothetical protein
MKFLLGIIIIFLRFYIGIQILYWIILKIQSPQSHNLSEIELYLVVVLFDTWICASHGDVEIKLNKKED